MQSVRSLIVSLGVLGIVAGSITGVSVRTNKALQRLEQAQEIAQIQSQEQFSRVGADVTNVERRFLVPDGEKLQVLSGYTAFTPSTDNAQDLGTSTSRWRNLFIAGSLNASSSILTSATTTNLAVTSLTPPGVIAFATSGGHIVGDARFTYNNTANKLSIGGVDEMLVNGVKVNQRLQTHNETDTDPADIEIHRFSNSLTVGPTIYGSLASGNSSTPNIASSSANLLDIVGVGYTGSSTIGYSVGARINLEADGDFQTSSSPGRIAFYTTPTGTVAAVERMRVTNQGNVGIGITSPSAFVEANGAVRSDRTGVPGQYVQLDGGDATGPIILASSTAKSLRINNSGSGGIVFQTVGGGSPVQITDAGYLAINSTTPISQLAIGAKVGIDPMNIVSTTGASMVKVDTFGRLIIGNQTAVAGIGGVYVGAPNATFDLNASSGAATLRFLEGNSLKQAIFEGFDATGQMSIYSYATGKSTASFAANGRVGINSTSPIGMLSVKGDDTVSSSTLVLTDSVDNELFRVLTNGKTGVGTSSPVAQLSVQGIAGTDGIRYSSTSPIFVARPNGNVGIGTATPLAKLSIGDNSILDGSVPLQLSTGGVSSQANIGVNKNGAYGFLLGYYNGVNFSSLTGLSAGFFRMVTNDPLVFALGNTKPTMLLDAAGNVVMGGNITSTSTFAGSVLVVKGTGGIGVNTTTPAGTGISASGTVFLANLNTSITGNGLCLTTTGEVTDAGAAACIPSALKYKTNVSPYSDSAVSLFVKLVQAGAVSNYELKSKPNDPRKGLIADVVNKVDHDLVGFSPDGSVNTLHFEDLTGLAVKAIAEQQAQIADLQEQIIRLEAKVGGIEWLLRELKTLFTKLF